MPKLKTATIILIGIIVLSLAIFLIPFEELFSKLPYVNQFYNNTTVTITSKNSKNEVFLDSKSYGETPVTISDLEPGRYTFKLKRISDIQGAYEERFVDIEIERNTEAVIELEIAPDSVASGYVLYYTKSPVKNDKGYISVVSDPSDALIYIDGEYASKSPINAYLTNPKSYTIKINQTGYEGLEFPVIVTEGYNLNIRAFLLPIPIIIDEKTDEQ